MTSISFPPPDIILLSLSWHLTQVKWNWTKARYQTRGNYLKFYWSIFVFFSSGHILQFIVGWEACMRAKVVLSTCRVMKTNASWLGYPDEINKSFSEMNKVQILVSSWPYPHTNSRSLSHLLLLLCCLLGKCEYTVWIVLQGQGRNNSEGRWWWWWWW